MTAINVETGAEMWQVADLYPTNSGKTRAVSSHEAAPSSGIPGGAVPVDTTATTSTTKSSYGTLYGDVFVRNAAAGVNQNGAVSGSISHCSASRRLQTDRCAAGGLQEGQHALRGVRDRRLYGFAGNTVARRERVDGADCRSCSRCRCRYTGATINETSTTNVPIKFDMGAGEGWLRAGRWSSAASYSRSPTHEHQQLRLRHLDNADRPHLSLQLRRIDAGARNRRPWSRVAQARYSTAGPR